MTTRQPWRVHPERWNRQIIYRFPNGYGASIIAEVDWDRMVPTERFPVRDDIVEIGLIRFDGDQYALARDEDGEQTIWREVPINEVDTILDEIEALERPEISA